MIASAAIPIRTAEGRAELGTRQRRLSQRHRTVLFLVDGKRSVAEVRRMASQAGVIETCFDELVASGLIEVPVSIAPATPAAPAVDAAGSFRPAVDPLQRGADPDSRANEAESVLPPSRSLPPESVSAGLNDTTAYRARSAWQALVQADSIELAAAPGRTDPAFDEARSILLRAVRAEAPLAGSLTLMRLRRARRREDLHGLLDEVEARIARPHRVLTTQQTLHRVRLLLGSQLPVALAETA